jgi:pimeloyl-ACP methyl ester carboxylesterase
LRAANAELQWLARSQPLALGAEWSIRGEAMCRHALGLPVEALGIPTSAGMRRAEEREASQRGRVGREASGRPRRAPLIHWHEGGSGPPLLLLNGWAGSGLAWPTAWLHELEAHFRVLRVDQRGTGWSRDAPAPFTIGDMADDARDVLGACEVDRATVVGYSMGGMVAQELAIRHPWRVERLVLVATVPPSPAKVLAEYPYPFPTIALLSMLMPGVGLRRLVHMMGRAAAPGFADERPELIDELVSQMLSRVTPRQMVLAQGRAMSSWHGPKRLARLRSPTVVVQGADDRLVPCENARRLSKFIPQADMVELPDVGHLVFHEAGDEILRLLGCDAPRVISGAA